MSPENGSEGPRFSKRLSPNAWAPAQFGENAGCILPSVRAARGRCTPVLGPALIGLTRQEKQRTLQCFPRDIYTAPCLQAERFYENLCRCGNRCCLTSRTLKSLAAPLNRPAVRQYPGTHRSMNTASYIRGRTVLWIPRFHRTSPGFSCAGKQVLWQVSYREL